MRDLIVSTAVRRVVWVAVGALVYGVLHALGVA